MSTSHEIVIARADPLSADDVDAPDLVITVSGRIPGTKTLNDARDFYEQQARLLNSQLSHHLPGGTYDALLRQMLLHKASLLRVTNKGQAERGGEE